MFVKIPLNSFNILVQFLLLWFLKDVGKVTLMIQNYKGIIFWRVLVCDVIIQKAATKICQISIDHV